jgi:hypothetical protein
MKQAEAAAKELQNMVATILVGWKLASCRWIVIRDGWPTPLPAGTTRETAEAGALDAEDTDDQVKIGLVLIEWVEKQALADLAKRGGLTA